MRPFALLRILYAGPGCKSGPAGFKAGQAFTAVYNRASRLYGRPARFKTGRPAIKPAAGFQAGQVYNRALTYIYHGDIYIIIPWGYHGDIYIYIYTVGIYNYYIYIPWGYIYIYTVGIYIYIYHGDIYIYIYHGDIYIYTVGIYIYIPWGYIYIYILWGYIYIYTVGIYIYIPW